MRLVMDRKEKRRTFSPAPQIWFMCWSKTSAFRSLTSIINEDCFHDSRQKKPPPTLKLATNKE